MLLFLFLSLLLSFCSSKSVGGRGGGGGEEEGGGGGGGVAETNGNKNKVEWKVFYLFFSLW